MTRILTPPGPRAGPLARFVGVIFSPEKTLSQVTADPRWVTMIPLVCVLPAVCMAAFLNTEVGRLAALDEQVRQIEAFGGEVTDALYQRLQGLSPALPYFSAAGFLIGWPLAWLVIAGTLLVVSGRALGDGASFQQVYAVVVHSWVIFSFRTGLTVPLHYVRESMTNSTNLAVFFPMLEEASFPARLLGNVDLFVLWWISVLAVGLAVLYRRRTALIGAWLFGAYAAVALGVAVIEVVLGGT